MVVVKVLFQFIGHKSGLHCFAFKGFPIKIFEPGMVLGLCTPLHAKALRGLSFQTSINKVSRLFCVP
jgi:hypothetical protein